MTNQIQDLVAACGGGPESAVDDSGRAGGECGRGYYGTRWGLRGNLGRRAAKNKRKKGTDSYVYGVGCLDGEEFCWGHSCQPRLFAFSLLWKMQKSGFWAWLCQTRVSFFKN